MSSTEFAVGLFTTKGLVYGTLTAVTKAAEGAKHAEIISGYYYLSDVFTRAYNEAEGLAIMMCEETGCAYKESTVTEVK